MPRASRIENKAYDYIKDQIKNQKWAEGMQIKELSVAGQLTISRTPVRKALKRLENEGLVSIKPNKGVYVSPQPLGLKERKDRIYYLEALLQHILYSLQLGEKKVNTSPLYSDLDRMQKEMASEAHTFEKLEIDFWNDIFAYHTNQYMNAMVVQTMSSLYHNTERRTTVFEKSRPIKLKHYKAIVQWLEEENYTYARREVRILLNQLLINLIQGVDD